MTLQPWAGVAQKNAAEAIDPSGKSLEHRKYYMKTLLLSAAIIAAFAPSAKADDITQLLPQVQHQPAPAAPKAPEQPAPPVQHQPEPKHAAPAPAKAPQAPAAAPSASSTSNSTSAAQAQAGAQAASQSRSGVSDSGNSASASRAYGGNSRNALTASGNGAGNNSGSDVTIRGNAAGSGDVSIYNSKATAWAPIIHGPAAPPVAAGNLIVREGTCGPLVILNTIPVIGKQFGAFGGQSDIEQDYFYRQEISPANFPFVEIDGRLMGHKITRYAVVVGTSSAGSWSVGGFGTRGEGGQGGSAGSGSLQQLVKQFDIEMCVYAEPKDAEPVERIVTRPAPVARPRPRLAPAPCVKEDKLIRVCKRSTT